MPDYVYFFHRSSWKIDTKDGFLPTVIPAILMVSDFGGGAWTLRSIGPSRVTPPNMGIIEGGA